MHGPDPNIREPLAGYPQVGFLKNFITQENIIVGDYTYYDDPDDVNNFLKNILYHFDKQHNSYKKIIKDFLPKKSRVPYKLRRVTWQSRIRMTVWVEPH